jgi:hypothetical protein
MSTKVVKKIKQKKKLSSNDISRVMILPINLGKKEKYYKKLIKLYHKTKVLNSVVLVRQVLQ